MLTKGIVEKIITPYKIKVRLPIFDAIEGTRNATETSELSEAIICSISNSSNHVSIGDKVIVGFEDDDISKPIILGHLMRANGDSTLTNLKLGSLIVEGNTNLNENTYIGDVKPNELKALSGVTSNIQGQIDNIKSSLGSGDIETNNIIVGETKNLNIRETKSKSPFMTISSNNSNLSINGFNFNTYDFELDGMYWDGGWIWKDEYHLVSPYLTGSVNRLTFNLFRNYMYMFGDPPTFDYENELITVPAGTRCDIAILHLPQEHSYTLKCNCSTTKYTVGVKNIGYNESIDWRPSTFNTSNSAYTVIYIQNNDSTPAIFEGITLIPIGENADSSYGSPNFDGYYRDVIYEGNQHGDLIWNSATQIMNSQTWSIRDSNYVDIITSILSYSYIVIEFYGWEGNEIHSMKFPVKDGEYTLYNVTGPTLNGINTRRFVISGIDSKIKTDDDWLDISITWQEAQVGNSAATSVKYYACVPFRIYGLR